MNAYHKFALVALICAECFPLAWDSRRRKVQRKLREQRISVLRQKDHRDH